MKGLTKRRLRWQNVRFYAIYLIVVLLIAGAIAYGLQSLSSLLADYEASRSKYVMDQVLRRVENGDYAYLLEMEGDVPYKNMPEEYAAYMNGQIAGHRLTTHTLYTAGSNDLTYNLYSDDRLIYKLTLSLTGEVNAHGYELWGLKSVENYTIQYAVYRLQAPQTAVVTANGKTLGVNNIVERGILTGYEDHLISGITPPTNVVYSLDTYFGKPDFVVTDNRGRRMEIPEDETGLMVAQTNYDDEELRPEREKNVLDTAEAMARFTIFDVSANNMKKLTYTDSRAYKYVRSFDTTWPFATFGHSFTNEKTENYIQWADEYFSCDVTFDFYVKYRAEARTNVVKYRMYFRQSGNKWLLYDFETR